MWQENIFIKITNKVRKMLLLKRMYKIVQTVMNTYEGLIPSMKSLSFRIRLEEASSFLKYYFQELVSIYH